MARPLDLSVTSSRAVILRLADPELQRLKDLVFSRYPRLEWASFAWFGWRETAHGLVLTLAALEPPQPGDLDESVSHVAIDEQYSLRSALASEKTPLALGVIHSHPANSAPVASLIDDDMDRYYSGYFAGFAPDRPYLSLIFSEVDGRFVVSGRVFWRSRWLAITMATADGERVGTWVTGLGPQADAVPRHRTARLNSAFGDEAAISLRQSTVAIVGAGGTGSSAIEVLARAGLGRLLIVDPDHIDESNLERLHGSTESHARSATPKVVLARDHVRAIDPSCEVIALLGRLPQEVVLDWLLQADILLSCTDSQASRLAASDLAVRYLLPAIDCAVALEGKNGRITGQITQFVRFFPSDPCALCRRMTIPARVAQELMSDDEIARRRAAAAVAIADGGAQGGYWHEAPQLNTVGYLTTAAGALAAGYAIGYLTHRFPTPFSRIQLNIQAPAFDVVDHDVEAVGDCSCRRVRGWSNQAAADAYVSPPTHWSDVQQL